MNEVKRNQRSNETKCKANKVQQRINKPLNQTQCEAKILLAKAIIKKWGQATEQEKKEIERWWGKTYWNSE